MDIKELKFITMDPEEIVFITYRESLRAFIQHWRIVLDHTDPIPTATANSLLTLEDALEQVNYKLQCERKHNDK